MAEAFPEKYEKSFECSVCLDLFHRPGILPCGHSFCGSPRMCLAGVIGNLNECPICKTSFNWETNSKLCPLNFSLFSGIEHMKSSKNRSFKSKTRKSVANGGAEMCEKHEEENEFYCRKCSDFLCRQCWVLDHSDPPENHDVVLFSQFKKNEMEIEVARIRVPINEKCLDEIEKDYKEVVSQILAVGDTFVDMRNNLKASDSENDKILLSKSPTDFNKQRDSFRNYLATLESLVAVSQSKICDVEKEVAGFVNKFKEITTSGKYSQDATLEPEAIPPAQDPPVTSGSVVRKKTTGGLSNLVKTPELRPAQIAEEGTNTKNANKFKIKVQSKMQFPDDFYGGGIRVVLDSNGRIFVFDLSETILRVTTKDNKFVPGPLIRYKALGDIEVVDIAISANQLYCVEWHRPKKTHSLYIFNSDTLGKVKKIDTTKVRNGECIYDWSIAGNLEKLALYQSNEKKLYVFEGEKLVNCVLVTCPGEQFTNLISVGAFLYFSDGYDSGDIWIIQWDSLTPKSTWNPKQTTIESIEPMFKDAHNNAIPRIFPFTNDPTSPNRCHGIAGSSHDGGLVRVFWNAFGGSGSAVSGIDTSNESLAMPVDVAYRELVWFTPHCNFKDTNMMLFSRGDVMENTYLYLVSIYK